jgi:hypothetical protein
MKRTVIALAVALPALAPSAASAQVSIWLQRGVSGYGGAASIQASGDATELTASGGYSYQGFLDFDLNLNYYSLNKDNFQGASVSAYGLAPVVQYHPIKQSAEVPVSLGLSAGVEKIWFSSPDFTAGSSINAFNVGVGVSVYRFVKLAPSFGVIPAAAFGVNHAWTTTTVAGMDTTAGTTGESLQIGAYFAYIDDAGRIFGLVPSLTFAFGDSTSTIFGLEFSIIVSQQ